MKISDRFREADRFPLNSKMVTIILRYPLDYMRYNRSYSNIYITVLDRASRTKLGHFTNNTRRNRRGEEWNTDERVIVEILRKYTRIVRSMVFHWKGRQFWRGEEERRCRFPSTIRRNNRGGAGRMQMSRDRAGHETRRDTGSKVHRARAPNAE